MNRQVENVCQEIANAITQAIPVNFNRFKHRWIVEALHRLVFNRSNESVRDRKIRVTFSDGSETWPFPVGCLNLSDPPNASDPVLRVGLNSGRHPEMDRFVEVYLFRNADIATLETISDQEQYAFQQGMAFLQNPEWKDGGTVELHQTGLEPLIIGFYRAVVTESLRRKRNGLPPVMVIPRSWSPAELSIRRYVRSRFSHKLSDEIINVHIQSCASALAQLAETVPGFFSLQSTAEDTIFKWLPERPMWHTELDFLLHRFSRVKSILKYVYDRSQFTQHPHWGYSI